MFCTNTPKQLQRVLDILNILESIVFLGLAYEQKNKYCTVQPYQK